MDALTNTWIAFTITGLILGHAVWGRRWMFDGTRGILSAYARLYRAALDRVAARHDRPSSGSR